MSRQSYASIGMKKLYAEIGDYVFDDIMQYTASFARNSIPTAAIAVAVGRNMATGRLATIHDALGDISATDRVHVYLRTEVLSEELAEAGVGNQELKIFEGRISGVGWNRSAGSAGVVLHLIHWLADLNHASAISASMHPGSAYDLAYAAIFPSLIPDSHTPSTTPTSSWKVELPSAAINAVGLGDLWGNILYKWLESLAKSDPYDNALLRGSNAFNPDTLAAVQRLRTADNAPLALDLHGADGAIIASSIRRALLEETGGNWINNTLWGKLVGEWASSYLFSVIPRVEDALIVPFVGGLQEEPWAVIGSEDYVFADIPAQLRQKLRTVGIAHPAPSTTGFDMRTTSDPVYQGGLLGVYVADSVPNGMLLLKQPPPWLACPEAIRHLQQGVEGMNNTPFSTAVDEAGIGSPPTGPSLSLVYGSQRALASAYAHQLYVLEALKGRGGEVVGKLRFDIAPGSNVLLAAGGSKNVEPQRDVGMDLYATVVQVSYIIDAANEKAATAFTLDHVRTAEEFADKTTSVPKPPLYMQAWRGDKLVPDAPGPET